MHSKFMHFCRSAASIFPLELSFECSILYTFWTESIENRNIKKTPFIYIQTFLVFLKLGRSVSILEFALMIPVSEVISCKHVEINMKYFFVTSYCLKVINKGTSAIELILMSRYFEQEDFYTMVFCKHKKMKWRCSCWTVNVEVS